MNGIDWAYSVLVDIALAHSREHVKSRAAQFRKDVLDSCVGMACADIDHHVGKKTSYAYHTVLDVCLELTKETV
jgi:hypothetical protein